MRVCRTIFVMLSFFGYNIGRKKSIISIEEKRENEFIMTMKWMKEYQVKILNELTLWK